VEGVDELLGRNADFVTNSMGVDEVVNYTVESVPGWVKAWKLDAIVDCVGGTECLGDCEAICYHCGG